jgi:serine/threonine-protein kinase HipA
VADRLQVWLDGVHVADIERRRRSDLRLRLRYTEQALERWPWNTPLVSCSLPLRDRPADASAFLRGLLPEGDALAAVAARARTSVIDTFGLLERYGRDIAGALVIGPDAPDESRFALEPYDDESLGEEVGALDENPLGIHDDSELSLAGLQSKLLLVKTQDGWARPLHGRPSTHILKAEDRRFPGLAQAEAGCLELARAAGLTSVDSELQVLAGIPCLIVERYDRAVAVGGSVARVHQEDLCQAVGVDGASNRGRAKYQRRAGGGPGLRAAARLLDAYAEDAPAELARLVSAVAFTVAVGNADAHAKNLSFLHDTAATIRLAPLYDIVPTLLWPTLTEEAAMSVNGRFPLGRLTVADIADEAASWPFDRRAAEHTATETIERVRAAADGLGLEPLATIVTARCEALLAGKPAAGRSAPK